MRDLSDTVEMATLDKEMAEERVSANKLACSIHRHHLFVRVKACKRRWKH